MIEMVIVDDEKTVMFATECHCGWFAMIYKILAFQMKCLQPVGTYSDGKVKKHCVLTRELTSSFIHWLNIDLLIRNTTGG